MFKTYNSAQVLITGGAGFIGSALTRRLVELGAEVTVVDSLITEYGGNLRNLEQIRDCVQLNISDVRDSHSMKYLVEGKSFIFNLAGQTSHEDSMTNPFPDLEINCTAQLSLLEACRYANKDCKLVFASTRQLYGKPDYLPVDENHLLRPVDVNGVNKMAGEWYHILYNNVYGIRSCALRLTNTYGPGMRIKDARQTFLGIWIRKVLEGSPIEVWGGDQLRDFNYVEDAVNAFLMAGAMEETNGQIYNLGSSEVLSLKDLATLLIDANGSGECDITPFPESRKRIDIGDYYASFDKFAALGWKPEVTMAQGLKKTLQYYQENLDAYL